MALQAEQIQTGLAVSEVNDAAGFAALETEWDALVARAGDQLFYRHAFIRIWLDNFGPRARLRVLLAREGDKLVAALPLIEERGSLYGVPVRQLAAAANPHSCRFDLVAEDPEAAAQMFFGHLRADRSWDVLRLIDVPEGGNGWALLRAAQGAGFATGTWQSLASPFIPLPATNEELQNRLDRKFKANLRRRRKKLEEKGKVTFERIDGGPELARALEEGFLLESSGWKGERGTAIAQDAATRGFYTELARTMSYKGQLALYFLRLDGRPIAFHFGLVDGPRYLLLKPGYDESLRECSPGQLLMEQVVEDCIARKLTEFDFLGPDMTWKRDWTDQVRVHTWLYVFRDNAFGRALCAAKFRWVPMAKEAVARWK
jgi:CelD/BcsL family acetyltransferase involved in cellulose biosynthesis